MAERTYDDGGALACPYCGQLIADFSGEGPYICGRRRCARSFLVTAETITTYKAMRLEDVPNPLGEP